MAVSPELVKMKLERITGLDVQVQMNSHKVWFVYGYRDGKPWILLAGMGLNRLQDQFLVLNLQKIRDMVFANQRYRCAVCGELRPLELDHITPRSKGRDDRVENLQGICRRCHRSKTGHLHWSSYHEFAGQTGKF